MKTFVALLRGINVSGQKKVPMAQLRQQLQDLGLKGVQTYIQSGNIVFTHTASVEKLTNMIHTMIKEKYGFDVPVLILTESDLRRTVENNPYLPAHEDEMQFLHVTYLEGKPEAQKVESLRNVDMDSGKDVFSFKDQFIYLYCPGGYGKTKFNNNFFESKLKVKATTRNWKTTLQLWHMIQEV
ncbi:MAG: hypothetical protein CMI36_00615 [Owenweeksia sp.]|nr:hypothetical protein [Owenweeksia sp.]MBF97467.1 hypothetical protein [Owenweeksia sp.]HBF20400.1 DUF1697 domain-containing protein [Cryomorphaceae bacterium]HCQ17494.1 DUF1697 domain-containing protein [Cryomorphaceae bacterium]